MNGHFLDLGIYDTDAEALYGRYVRQLEEWFIDQTKAHPRHNEAFAKRYWEEQTKGLLTRI